MHVYTLDVFTIDIAAYMRSPVDDQTFQASVGGLVSECGAEQAGSHYKVIVRHSDE